MLQEEIYSKLYIYAWLSVGRTAFTHESEGEALNNVKKSRAKVPQTSQDEVELLTFSFIIKVCCQAQHKVEHASYFTLNSFCLM